MAKGRAVNIRDAINSESLAGQIGFSDGAEVLRRSLLKAFPEIGKYPDSIVGQDASVDFDSVIAELGLPKQAQATVVTSPDDQGEPEIAAKQAAKKPADPS